MFLHSGRLFLRLYLLTKSVCSGFQLAEKYFVKGGDPRAAIEMYTKANMYEAAHKVTFLDSSCCLPHSTNSLFIGEGLTVFVPEYSQLAVQCMTQEEVAVIYISQAQELEAQGKYKEAER